MLRDLIARRVPHILGVYLAAGWGALEFTNYLADRYTLSPHLADFILALWALMVPTVLILAYLHGRPGRDEWTRIEKISIPVNVMLAGMILYLSFAGKELGSATTEVTIRDETGAAVQRVVPKSEFRKRIALFWADNQTADTTLNWLQYGLVFALYSDLDQDQFISAQIAPDFSERLRETGYRDGLDVPLTLKQDIAERQHLDYFLEGELRRDEGGLALATRLYETRRGKLLRERTFSGGDPLALVDRISVQLKQDLEIPQSHIEEVKDLRAVDLLTDSEEAFRSLSNGIRALTVTDDWAGAVSALQRAVEIDPSFAIAHAILFSAHMITNDSEAAAASLRRALDLSYKLPERSLFSLRATYFQLVEEDMERAVAVASMYAELFPDDVDAHVQLASFHEEQLDYDRAIQEHERILELDPGRSEQILSIGRLYERKGDRDAALREYERYAKLHPNDYRSFTSIGDLYAREGRHDLAREQYERALLLEPDNVDILLSLAQNDANLGRFADAAEHLEQALEAAASSEPRARVLQRMRSFSESRGQMRRAMQLTDSLLAEVRANQPPLAVLFGQLNSIDDYVRAGRTELARSTLASLEAEIQRPMSLLIPFGYAQLYDELERPDELESSVEGVEVAIERLGFAGLSPYAVYARGRVLELRGECDQAVISYRRTMDMDPTNSTHTDIGRCQRETGDTAGARTTLAEALRLDPFDAETRVEMAKTLLAAGDSVKARAELETALEVWEDADDDYEPAREARLELRRISGTP